MMSEHPNDLLPVQVTRMEVDTGLTDEDILRHLEGEFDGKAITRGADTQTSKALETHRDNSHSPKDPSCPACQEATGTAHIHNTTPEHERATRILHVDLSGPHAPGWPYDYRYALIGVAKVQKSDGSNYPLLPFVRSIPSKTSADCCSAISSTLNQK